MDVRLLVLHRKESYPGQFAPEVLAVCDEWTMEENSQWWPQEMARHRDLVGADAAAWAEVTVDLDAQELLKALYPTGRVSATLTGTRALPGLTAGADPVTADPAIGAGSWVCDVHGDGEDADDYGYVTRVVDGGYAVIWRGDLTAKFAAADEVAAVAEIPEEFLAASTRL